MFVTDRQSIVDSFVCTILGRIQLGRFQESLQQALDSVLNGLDDAVQADLYARIVHRYDGLSEQSQRDGLRDIVRSELTGTNLWSLA